MPPRLISDTMLELFPMVRTPGHHVSSAIHAIMAKLYPARFGSGPIDQMRAILGNALEHAIVEAYARDHPERFVRPGEIECEGLLGTPDLWDLEDPYDPATVEIKLTWASSRRADDIEDEWFVRYWWQLKAYNYMARLGMSGRGFTRGRLIIVFLVGNWRDDSAPKGLMWEDEWTDGELAENWEMIKRYVTPE